MKKKNMTRKTAIDIVVSAAKAYSKYAGRWKACAVTIRAGRGGDWGRTFAVGFFGGVGCPILHSMGFTERPEGGYNFTRKWLKDNGHL